jgi:hypothetical protein
MSFCLFYRILLEVNSLQLRSSLKWFPLCGLSRVTPCESKFRRIVPMPPTIHGVEWSIKKQSSNEVLNISETTWNRLNFWHFNQVKDKILMRTSTTIPFPIVCPASEVPAVRGIENTMSFIKWINDYRHPSWVKPQLKAWFSESWIGCIKCFYEDHQITNLPEHQRVAFKRNWNWRIYSNMVLRILKVKLIPTMIYKYKRYGASLKV